MEITGKIIHVLPETGGQSQKGSWKKQEYVIETKAQYPKKICFSAWGDKIDQFGIRQGEEVTVSIDIESREYNGRWYTEVKAWKVNKGSGSNAGGGGAPLKDEDFLSANPGADGESGDLPF